MNNLDPLKYRGGIGRLIPKVRDPGEPPSALAIPINPNENVTGLPAGSNSPTPLSPGVTDLQFNASNFMTAAPAGKWTQIVASNPNAIYLMIQNQHASDAVYLYFGSNPGSLTNGVLIVAGGAYEWNDKVPVSAIYATSATANAIPLQIVQG